MTEPTESAVPAGVERSDPEPTDDGGTPLVEPAEAVPVEDQAAMAAGNATAAEEISPEDVPTAPTGPARNVATPLAFRGKVKGGETAQGTGPARPGPRPVPHPPARPGAQVVRPTGRPRPLPHAPHPAPHPPAASAQEVLEAAQAAAWGRVDDDGTVWVREASGERSVGQYAGADSSEALAFYVRRFLDLQAQVALFEVRLPQVSAKEADHTLATLTEALVAPAAVGDLDGLRTRLDVAREDADRRRAAAAAEREAAKAHALAARTELVEQVEAIAAADPARTQWRQAGERLQALLAEWKEAQRHGPRIDRAEEDALWKRFSHARATFDRGRRQFFAEVERRRAEARATKEAIVEEAERLAESTDWSATAVAYRSLMDRWKAAGRAAAREDDALWERFRAAQDAFYAARTAATSATDAEFTANLQAKLALLAEAEALLPISDLGQAKAALRAVQDRWDAIGKVPRADVQRVEARLRAVEQAVRDAQQDAWARSNPETKARARGALAQLEASIASLEAEYEAARAVGNEAAAADAQTALAARRAWLVQLRRTAGEGH